MLWLCLFLFFFRMPGADISHRHTDKQLLFWFPSPLTCLCYLPKTVKKNNNYKAAFRKMIIPIHTSWCILVQVACLLKLTQEMGFWENWTLHWGWEKQPSEVVWVQAALWMVGRDWVPCTTRSPGGNMQMRAGFRNTKKISFTASQTFRAGHEHRKEKCWFQYLELSAISATL